MILLSLCDGLDSQATSKLSVFLFCPFMVAPQMTIGKRFLELTKHVNSVQVPIVFSM